MTTAARPELRVARGGPDGPVVITGGAGFIGSNLAHRYLCAGAAVTVLDNLSRPGVDRNIAWLRERHGSLLRFEAGDIRDTALVSRMVSPASRVVHLAAQVAMTTSVADPVADFEVNALGTLNVLEALRRMEQPPPLLFTSTNKVYGCLEDVDLQHVGRRYEPVDSMLREHGIDEGRGLDFHSPYGCSKGAADQYVLDYCRTYGLPAVVFRMSCIYGPHQFGTEDQGWVAHFLIRAMAGTPITLYGSGHQVRDVLFVDDLVDAMDAAFASIDAVRGRAFNIGGGPAHTASLVEVIDAIGDLLGRAPDVQHGPWRTGDQRYYVSDTSRFSALTGWRPQQDLNAGLGRLHRWLVESSPTAERTDDGPGVAYPGGGEDRLRSAAAAAGKG
jgi:CDP-paratose 2-epimerase